mmetsp:Transcript_22937/g.40600  ORF Transcript_22937/g.40600 Transcript_22937/m.40600 type:complete len:207 (-) Transcript_22937:1097-1717(-)
MLKLCLLESTQTRSFEAPGSLLSRISLTMFPRSNDEMQIRPLRWRERRLCMYASLARFVCAFVMEVSLRSKHSKFSKLMSCPSSESVTSFLERSSFLSLRRDRERIPIPDSPTHVDAIDNFVQEENLAAKLWHAWSENCVCDNTNSRIEYLPSSRYTPSLCLNSPMNPTHPERDRNSKCLQIAAKLPTPGSDVCVLERSRRRRVGR